jgi:hypothetical protein
VSNHDVESKGEVDIAEKIFANAPNMLVLCLTVIGLIKIYTRFEKITTLADNYSLLSRWDISLRPSSPISRFEPNRKRAVTNSRGLPTCCSLPLSPVPQRSLCL